ncbi:BA75_04555T0 [Komagataella pastoris]|uniref:Peroxisome assembly protein 12 n=1 Tax=Komagataella pastoris TaxID=4922 RepID=A0A1B2JJC6_PICPA|nr:BA75_04555T0 [Komagataella pastoris]
MDFYSNLDSRSLDSETPTLFEIISAQELEKLLTPSIRYILVHYTQRYPRYLLKVANHFDELNLAIRGFIEFRQLSHWNSTFIDKFYGLKKVRNHHTISTERLQSQVPTLLEQRRRLSKTQIAISLFEIVGVPYIRDKLDHLYDKLYPKLMMNNLDPKESLKTFVQYYFLKLYPILLSALTTIQVLLQVLYLSGTFKSPSIIMWLFKMKYARLNSYDYNLDEQRVDKFLNKSSAGRPKTSNNRIRPVTLTESLYLLYSDLTRPLKKGLLITGGTLFPASIFLLKFLEWWNSSDFATKMNKPRNPFSDSELPPPINLSKDLLTDRKIKKLLKKSHSDDGACPLCHKQITNPAVVETGYVFCYTCIFKHLTSSDLDEETGGRCPITGRRLLGCRINKTTGEWTVDGIRRLMM